MMVRQNYGLFFALLASLLLSMMYTPYFNPLSGDKEVYRYIGQLILKGGVPYRDVFDHKPPLVFFLNSAGLLFGKWGLWLIDTIVALVATFLFFRLGKKYRLPYPGLLPLLFNLMLRDFLICLGMGMTREYTTIFLLIFFCVLIQKDRYRYFLLGLVSGLIFFMQQDQVLALVPFFLYAFQPEDDDIPLLARLLRTSAGFLTVALPLILYFAWYHSLKYFWQDAFLFNFSWYTGTLKETFGDHLRKIKMVLDAGNYEVPFLVAVALGVSALALRSKRKKLIFAALAATVLSLSAEFMGGRDTISNVDGVSFTHYVLPLAASLSILLFTVFAFSDEEIFQGWKAQGVYGILICTSVCYTALQHGTHLEPMKKDYVVGSPELNYLRQHKPRDYELYVFGSTGYIYAYNQFGIVGPSPWVYQHFWKLYDHWDSDHQILQGIGADLLKHHTTYVIDLTTPMGWFRDPTASAWWHSFLQEHFQPVVLSAAGHATLWRLKE
jgi:hypothetical protein